MCPRKNVRFTLIFTCSCVCRQTCECAFECARFAVHFSLSFSCSFVRLFIYSHALSFVLLLLLSFFFSPCSYERVFFSQARYVQNNSLAGAMFWSLDLDDFSGQACGHGTYPLLQQVRQVFEGITGTVIGAN